MTERRERLYQHICAELGYPRQADRLARDYLARRISRGPALPDFHGANVVICGAGPSLAGELGRLDAADAIVTASTATDVVTAAGHRIDLMVTDLDKNPETAARLSNKQVPVAIHAHGDNLELLRRWVPRCDDRWVIPTTQARPVAAVVNPGGFTDGDRAAYLADRAGASSLEFIGWDLDDPTVEADKAVKLHWAAVALLVLGDERGEEYGWIDATAPTIAARWDQIQ